MTHIVQRPKRDSLARAHFDKLRVLYTQRRIDDRYLLLPVFFFLVLLLLGGLVFVVEAASLVTCAAARVLALIADCTPATARESRRI